MNLRRRFLARLGLLSLTPFAWWSRSVQAAAPWLSFRPAAFEVTTESALIWVCCDTETSVRVQYAAGEGWGEAMLSEPVRLASGTGYTAAIPLKGLQPDRPYRFRITDADGKPRDADFANGSFRTAPAAVRDFAFVFSGDTHARHRPFKLFELMAEKKPDFFVHLGDTVYADSPRSQFRAELDYYRIKHREVRSDTYLQKFLAAIPTFATWDDHEVENDFTSLHPAIPIGRQAFREFWPVRNEKDDDATVLYRRFKWSPACEFFMLDTRQYRDQGGYGPGLGLTLLGARQLLWLKAGLKASTATFKFICTSVPFHQGGVDKWGGFKVERQALVDFIRQEGIRNVVILSADLHAAGDLSDDKTGLTEFLVGPIAAPLQPVLAPNSRTRETARPGSYVGDEYNFGLIRIAQREGKTVLRHEVVDAQGKVRYSREIVVAV
ncbi:MAG: alkaline phosphatase D family protein [Betaproteobacteria bacterium]|nr:alkaline phosphatase D family protein [Betaproteobacteria bacterium]